VAFDINERLNYAWEWAKNQKSRKPKPNPTDRTDRADRTDKMVWDRKLCNGCCQISRSMGANLSLATMLMCAADTSISIAYKMRFFNFNLNTQCMAGGQRSFKGVWWWWWWGGMYGSFVTTNQLLCAYANGFVCLSSVSSAL